MRDIADTGLNLCLEVINNFATAADPAVTNAFFQQYFLSILQDIFFVLTDADHKSGFKLQSALLARLFQLVEINVIVQPLYDPAAFPDTTSNAQFLRNYTANLLKSAFPHVSSSQVTVFVTALFDHNNDIVRFKLALRDFLIQLKEFSAGDNADLFLEEKELESQQKADAERQTAMRIPGMLKPSQLDDRDEDI
jgi:exportin-1